MRFNRPLEYLFLPLAFALVLFALLMLTANNYGIFTDELYYVACAQHLDFGYVDHPPFIAWVTRLSLLFGSSLYVLRVLPALAGSGTIILAALISRALGGGRFASAFASLTILCGTFFWVMFGFVSMNAYDVFFVTLASYLFILILKKGSAHLWVLFGVVVGIGLNTKLSMLVIAFGLFVGLVLTPERRLFRTRFPYTAAAVAFALYFPHILWQVVHGWPTVEFIRLAHEKNLDISVPGLLGQLAFTLNLFLLPVWLIGLVELLSHRISTSMRPLGIAIVVYFVVYLMNRSKFYYLIPPIPVLLAAGAVTLDRLTEAHGKRWIRTAAIIPIVSMGIATLPFGLPVLPIESFVSYARLWGLQGKIQMERNDAKVIPGYFGQRIGWDAFAKTVASVYKALPDSDRTQCGILGFHYGESGAVDYFGPSLGLPRAIGRHMSYWLWGPREYSGKVMIVIISGPGRIDSFFRTVKLCTTYEFPYVDDQNRVKRIYLCRDPIEPMPKLWQRIKEFG
ncbi:MAG TPA: glycosyltransferase family 39 protein [Candidatus Acidoferrales bacterium]|nr:glycosyltransferase family 39 protein [Candidatus Acidoferrales bacterium]